MKPCEKAGADTVIPLTCRGRLLNHALNNSQFLSNILGAITFYLYFSSPFKKFFSIKILQLKRIHFRKSDYLLPVKIVVLTPMNMLYAPNRR